MPVLNEQDRKDVWAEMMRAPDGQVTITKQDLRAAVDAIDAWLDTNAGSLNAAIPQPARGALSARQKAKLVVHVIQRRWARS